MRMELGTEFGPSEFPQCAVAPKQFVLNVTGNMSTQWMWERFLWYSIEATIDVGVKFQSRLQPCFAGTKRLLAIGTTSANHQ